MRDNAIDTLTLTTARAESSYGMPVLVIEGAAYGPADMTPAGMDAGTLVLRWAAHFCANNPDAGDLLAAALVVADDAAGAELARQAKAVRETDGGDLLTDYLGLSEDDRRRVRDLAARLSKPE